MDKRFVGILAALVIIFGGIFIFSKNSDNKGGGSSGGQASKHITGKGQSGVTFLEYGDYQCPACESYEPVMERLRSTFSKEIFFQFKNLPLVSLHPNAFSAARAAEAASLQNKFWEMHDLLYKSTNWIVWKDASNPQSQYENYAGQLALNVDQFRSDYSSEKVNDTVNADLSDFKKTGATMATPSLFIDSQNVDLNNVPNPQIDANGAFKKLSDLIKAAISKKSQ